jgi:AraC-like DNA-binding protein
MVLEDNQVTVKEMSAELGIGEASVCRIFKQLGIKKVCARWVPRMLTDAHKET